MARLACVVAAAICLVPVALAFAPPTLALRFPAPSFLLRPAATAVRMSGGEEAVESRRAVLLRVGVAAAAIAGGMGEPGRAVAQEAALGGELKADKKYNGPSAYGFSFKYPKSWRPNKQVGNAHLYNLQVTPGKDAGSGRISLTVDQVKGDSLAAWGTLAAASERLRAAAAKASKGGQVSVVRSVEYAKGGMTYYEIEVKSDTGVHEWSKLALTAEQLFALTLSSSSPGTEPFASEVLDSFTVKPNSMDNFQVTAKGQAPGVFDYLKQVPTDLGKVEAGVF